MTSDQIEKNWEAAGAMCACGCSESLPGQLLSRHKNGRLYWPGHEPKRPQLDETIDELARVTAKWSRLKLAARELIEARLNAPPRTGHGPMEFEAERRQEHWIVRPEHMNALEAAIQDEER